MSYFETEFGDKIEYWDDYYEEHNYRGYLGTQAGERFNGENKAKQNFSKFKTSVFLYGLMVDLLKESERELNGKRAIDIGGGTGMISRLLSMEGHIKETVTLDIQDQSKNLPKEHFIRQYKKYRSISQLSKYDPNIRQNLTSSDEDKFGYYPTDQSKIYSLKYESDPDRIYKVNDFIEAEFDKKFELVTAFRSLGWMDIDLAFNKISSILLDGGMFFFIMNNWWWPVNSTGIVGHFPYVCQRLTREDLKRYAIQEFPDSVDSVLESYDYFHKGQHPTLNDYLRIGYENGLLPIIGRYLFTNAESHSKVAYTPKVLERKSPGVLNEVLSNVHNFNTDVAIADLMSPYIVGAFVKRR